MTAPERIWATTNGIQPLGGSAGLWRSDTPHDATEYIRADLAAVPAQVRVKPLDLSNALKHAFIAGRVSAGAASSFHADAWVEYDPTESAGYTRILAALATPDQTAALDAVRAEARAHAMREAPSIIQIVVIGKYLTPSSPPSKEPKHDRAGTDLHGWRH